MKTKKTFRVFLTAVFVLVTMAMNAQTTIYVYQKDKTTDAYDISNLDSISFTPPVVAVDITDTYLKNTTVYVDGGFATVGDAIGTNNRYFLASDWLVNDAVAAVGDVDGSLANRLGFVAGTGWSAAVDAVVDGHIYQTINLPAGNYRFDAYVYDTASSPLDGYVVAQVGGDDLPSIDAIKNGTATASVAPILEAVPADVRISVPFTLSSAGPVSLGFVANNPGYTRIFFSSVKLWQL